ncbi:hypothetical protein CRM22_000134 [Opisthorchis felineus]|uniref:Mediator of RNA polymerase II transcription subunit 28 n=1 Tax=Opisthorchis felineus TaxID=147828 RepID=A0A4S2MGF7_OPIFE|nr:hypothetical protein CRM22_000134 [Opisthorchis felineus]TGZ75894.1 hypothetical protein CRM22_000134 [Opisthorchis felineus]TGZ75896.1 hypothetical protein CRM22_000134 [Opisthorchis felineus]
MEQTSETHDTPDKDNQIWTNFESQLDNIFLVLSSTNASADSDTSESRHGINDRHMASLLEACRDLDSWFVKKRFLLSSQRPDLLLQEELDAMHSETARKEKLIAETKVKLKQYADSISAIVEQFTSDLSYRPQLT